MTGTSPSGPLAERERVAWLRLIRSDNVGPATFRELLDHFGTAEAALDALPDLARRGGGRAGARISTRAQAEAEIEATDRIGARLIGIGEPLSGDHVRIAALHSSRQALRPPPPACGRTLPARGRDSRAGCVVLLSGGPVCD